MYQVFECQSFLYHVEIFQNEDSHLIRFFDGESERYREPLSDLVIAGPSYGFLHIKHVGEDAVLSGFLDRKYFSEDMVEDILDFLEEILPECRNCYLPYHLDFVTISGHEEYNGEY